MSIIHREDGSSQTWSNSNNNGFIRFSPKQDGGIQDSYIAARLGNQDFWCEDHKDFVYSIEGLLSKHSRAPAYMKRLARRAMSDLKTEAALLTEGGA